MSTNWGPPNVPTTPAQPAPLKRSRWKLAAIIIGSTVVALAIVNGQSGNDDPDVNPAYRAHIEVLRSDRDCVGLQDAFDRSNDADELKLVDNALRAAGCYGD